MASGPLTSGREKDLLDQIEKTRDYLNEMLGAIGAGIIQIAPPAGLTLDEWMATINDQIVELTETLERHGRS